MKLYDDLVWRGLIKDVSSPDLEKKLNEGGLTFYIGVDPTGDSLHIGHYSSVITMTKRLLDAGHNPIIIAGGGTGLIGDPKPSSERPMISKEAVKHNIECIKKQIDKLLKTDVKVINNADWLLNMDAIDYLRDYGKYFNINYMLSKETVKKRLDVGITYTEFSYMILQSIDFLKLYENYGCNMQIGGQDQWGNITSGLELIRKIHGVDTQCFGMTMPLLTRADGSKFGKSESGDSLYLDLDKTSAYEMYQYFVNSEDSAVIDYLKKLTFLSKEEIEKVQKEHLENPEKRLAHKTLAKEVITFIHGAQAYEDALKQADSLFKGSIKDLSSEFILNEFKDVPHFEINENESLLNILVDNNICTSKREAREMLSAGAISINGEKETNLEKTITSVDLIDGIVLLLKKGKKNYYIGTFKKTI